ncbi:hypothetical protein [Klebsiella pneumoniae]|uniref:hypothetical protein n=1 Tax=Klebsiella pneumoniae TaxID=573 RepID=UPI0038905DF6
MKTLLTSGCTNQRGAGQIHCTIFSPTASASLRMLPEQHAAEARYPIPVEDFHFSIFTAVNNQTVMTSSAEIVLVIEGTATLSHASGESLFASRRAVSIYPSLHRAMVADYEGRFRLRAK